MKRKAQEETARILERFKDVTKHLEEELAVQVGEAEESLGREKQVYEEKSAELEKRLSQLRGFRGFAKLEEAQQAIPRSERRYAALEHQNRHLAKIVEERDALLRELASGMDSDFASKLRE